MTERQNTIGGDTDRLHREAPADALDQAHRITTAPLPHRTVRSTASCGALGFADRTATAPHGAVNQTHRIVSAPHRELVRALGLVDQEAVA